MSKRVLLSPLAALSILPMLLAAGCSGRSAPLQPDSEFEPQVSAEIVEPGDAPDASLQNGRGAFFPLHLGNRWRYRGRIIEEVVFNSGPASRSERHYRLRSELICPEDNGGKSYLVARDVQNFGGPEFTQWIRYRQDRGGLFEADVSTNLPPACEAPGIRAATPGASGGNVAEGRASFQNPETQAAYEAAYTAAMAKLDLAHGLIGSRSLEAGARNRGVRPEGTEAGELTRLAYPLYVGARWQIRSDPRFWSHVVAHESLMLPVGRLAGFKVRILSELFGPDDHVAFWVSRKGFLKYVIRVVAAVTDVDGNVIGQLSVSERRELAGYHLQPGRSGEPHPDPEATLTD